MTITSETDTVVHGGIAFDRSAIDLESPTFDPRAFLAAHAAISRAAGRGDEADEAAVAAYMAGLSPVAEKPAIQPTPTDWEAQWASERAKVAAMSTEDAAATLAEFEIESYNSREAGGGTPCVEVTIGGFDCWCEESDAYESAGVTVADAVAVAVQLECVLARLGAWLTIAGYSVRYSTNYEPGPAGDMEGKWISLVTVDALNGQIEKLESDVRQELARIVAEQ